MPNPTTIEKALAGLLLPDERVELAVVCQPRRGQKTQLGRSAAALGLSTALSAASTALGASTGVLVVAIPPAVWVVVTNTRLLMFPRRGYQNTSRSIGALTFAAPRQALTATLKSGLFNTVLVQDAQDSQTLLGLRFGVRRSAARSVAQACTGGRIA